MANNKLKYGIVNYLNNNNKYSYSLRMDSMEIL